MRQYGHTTEQLSADGEKEESSEEKKILFDALTIRSQAQWFPVTKNSTPNILDPIPEKNNSAIWPQYLCPMKEN